MSEEVKGIRHITVEVTKAENTEIIKPSEGKRIVVHQFSISNTHTSLADVGLRFGATGEIRHRFGLASDGGSVPVNLIGAEWKGDVGQTLMAYAAAAYSNGVYFNIAYTEE